MPPPVYSRVANRVLIRPVAAGRRSEGKGTWRYRCPLSKISETRPAEMSRAQIAQRLHVDRGTVAKYADMEDCSPKPKADRRYRSKIDPYAHLVDGWLEADRLLPRKQRHDQARSTVCWRRRITTASIRPRCVTCTGGARRTWRAGSRGVRAARVGGGQHAGRFRRGPGPIAGEMADVHCLVVSLPYSTCGCAWRCRAGTRSVCAMA